MLQQAALRDAGPAHDVVQHGLHHALAHRRVQVAVHDAPRAADEADVLTVPAGWAGGRQAQREGETARSHASPSADGTLRLRRSRVWPRSQGEDGLPSALPPPLPLPPGQRGPTSGPMSTAEERKRVGPAQTQLQPLAGRERADFQVSLSSWARGQRLPPPRPGSLRSHRSSTVSCRGFQTLSLEPRFLLTLTSDWSATPGSGPAGHPAVAGPWCTEPELSGAKSTHIPSS